MAQQEKAEMLVKDFAMFLKSVPEDKIRVTRHDGVLFAVEMLTETSPEQE